MTLLPFTLILFRACAQRFCTVLLYLFFSLPHYPFSNKKKKHDIDIISPSLNLSNGNPQKGFNLTKGHYIFMGERQNDSRKRWNPVDSSILWKSHMHSFAWLSDLEALNQDNAFKSARFLMLDWIRQNREWTLPAWRSDIVAERLYGWLYYYDKLILPLHVDLRRIIHQSLLLQCHHLTRALFCEIRHGCKIIAQARLVCILLALSRNRRVINRAMHALEGLLAQQIARDGGHIERNPEKHAMILARLVEVQHFCQTLDIAVPIPILSAIDRMSLFMHLASHDDGGFAVFNGGNEGSHTLKADILDHIALKTERLQEASGYQRIQAGKAMLLIDTGLLPRDFDIHQNAHAGDLAFEFSVDSERLIVNCGTRRDHIDDQWRQAQRSSAAYSTVTIEHRNSRDLSWRMKRTAHSHVIRHPNKMGLSASHEGYHKNYSINCIREWRLNIKGTILYGRDRLIGPEGRKFIIRFHLHPDITVERVENAQNTPQSIILRTKNNQIFRFRQSGAQFFVSESIYCAGDSILKPTQQILLEGKTLPSETLIDWRFYKDT